MEEILGMFAKNYKSDKPVVVPEQKKTVSFNEDVDDVEMTVKPILKRQTRVRRIPKVKEETKLISEIYHPVKPKKKRVAKKKKEKLINLNNVSLTKDDYEPETEDVDTSMLED